MLDYITHRGVSCFFELLRNGLVRSQDNKRLNAQAEDAHWNQVRHIIPVERHINYERLCNGDD